MRHCCTRCSPSHSMQSSMMMSVVSMQMITHVVGKPSGGCAAPGAYLALGHSRPDIADARVLLRQASRLREAEPALQGVTSTVGSLQGALRRVRAEIMEPYDQARPFPSTAS